MYNKLEWGAGVVNGKAHASDRFFLGEGISGYKPMSIYPSSKGNSEGGVSFLKVGNKIGYQTSRFDLFAFSSLGFCSQQRSLLKAARSCLLALKYNTGPRNLGLSVGIGIVYPVNIKSIGKKQVQASFSIPFTNNPDTQRFRIGLAAEL